MNNEKDDLNSHFKNSVYFFYLSNVLLCNNAFDNLNDINYLKLTWEYHRQWEF